MPFRACLFLFLMLPALAAAQQLQLVLSPPASFDSATLGANGEKGFGFTFQKVGAGSLDGPFTVRVTLPPKVSFAASSGGGAACSAAGQVVTCVVDTTLTDWMWGSSGVGIYVDTAADLPVPGNSVLRATIESAQRPLPAQVACTVPSTPSQCIEATVPHRFSKVEFAPAFWQHSGTFEAGSLQTVSVGWRNTGYSQNNGQVTARFLLPPGVTYSSHGGNIPWVCNAAAAEAQGQFVTCTFAYFYDGMNEQFNNLYLHLRVGDDVAIPGPLAISATIANAQQPAPDIALCDDAQPPLGCGWYGGIPTRARRRSQLDVTTITQQPAIFTAQAEGRLLVDFRNLGDGAAGAMTLELAAPAGLAWNRLAGASPQASCSAAGAVASGQIVTCQFPAGLPEAFTGSAVLVFDVTQAARPQSTALAAIGDTTRPGPTLEACAAAPDTLGCGEYSVAVSPWIFCNGFEALPRTCGLPQGF